MLRLSRRIPSPHVTRRALLAGASCFATSLSIGWSARAAQSPAFAQWVAGFRPRALKRGISAQTFDLVMGAVMPDTSVYAQYRAQPEFTELMRSEEHTSELQSRGHLVCRLLLEKKKNNTCRLTNTAKRKKDRTKK